MGTVNTLCMKLSWLRVFETVRGSLIIIFTNNSFYIGQENCGYNYVNNLFSKPFCNYNAKQSLNTFVMFVVYIYYLQVIYFERSLSVKQKERMMLVLRYVEIHYDGYLGL